MVVRLLDPSLWESTDAGNRAPWVDAQAGIHAMRIVESEVLREHPASEVTQISLDEFELMREENGSRHYLFSAQAKSVNIAFPLRRRSTRVDGSMALRFDLFGRYQLLCFRHRCFVNDNIVDEFQFDWFTV